MIPPIAPREARGTRMLEARRATSEAEDVAKLRQIIEATRVAQVIYVVAELGLPDLLQDGPRSVEDLAGSGSNLVQVVEGH